MDKKDKEILKSSTIVIADHVADEIASKIPVFNIAWGLSKALLGAGLKLRQQRALEWVEMIRDNPNLFNKEILQSENFQDTFVFSFEKYISERNEAKRKIIKRIFLGYSQCEDFEKFEIERMISILSLVSKQGLELLQLLNNVLNTLVLKNNRLSEHLTSYLTRDSNDNPGKYNLSPGSNIRELWGDAETDLISIGILRNYNIPKYNGSNYHDYDLTTTGQEFIKYISA